jgi:uncharacterized protein (DUF433 family)
MSTVSDYQHLEPRPGSNYRQWFIKGRRIRAAVVYHRIHGPEPATPEEVAADFQIPIESIAEAIDYYEKNRDVIQADHDRETADIHARGLDRPFRG